MEGKLRPRFKSSLTELENQRAVEEPELAVGTPICPRCGLPDEQAPEYCRSCGMSMAKARRYGVDGPTEGVWTTPGPHGLLNYRSVRRRSTVFRVVLMLALVCGLASAFVRLAYYAGLDSLLPSLPVANRTWADWVDRLGIVTLSVLLVVCVTGAWWTSRAYRNLIPMQVRGLRMPVGLARAAWLLPFANVWLSKLVTDDLWRASDPAVGYRSTTWRKRPVALMSNVGWTGFVCALFLLPLAAVSRPDTVVGHEGQLRVSLLMGAGGYLLLALGFAILAVLVEQITDRQAARVDRLGTSPRPMPFTRRPPEEVEAEEAAAHLEAANEEARTGRLQHRPQTGDPVWGSY